MFYDRCHPSVASKNPIYIEDKRQQKNTLCLKDVRYRIWAKLEFIPVRKRKSEQLSLFDETAHPDENPAKYNAMFERRANKGQCFTQPYLGTRECSASFMLVNPEIDELNTPINESRDLGIMLYDMDFERPPPRPPVMLPWTSIGLLLARSFQMHQTASSSMPSGESPCRMLHDYAPYARSRVPSSLRPNSREHRD